MGISFVYAPDVYWEMKSYQNVTPDAPIRALRFSQLKMNPKNLYRFSSCETKFEMNHIPDERNPCSGFPFSIVIVHQHRRDSNQDPFYICRSFYLNSKYQ